MDLNSDEAHQRRRVAHAFHVLISQRQEQRGFGNWESWLYAAKEAAAERKRLPRLFALEREKKLPTSFQHCSHSPTEALPKPNVLKCCLGQVVCECPILNDVIRPLDGQFPATMLDEIQADTCVGHILWESAKAGHGLDGNEGYVQDVTDRMFWDRMASSLSSGDEEDQEP